METYQLFVVLIGNEKITEEMEFFQRAPVLEYQAREDLDNKEAPKDPVAPKDSVAPSDHI